MILLLSKLSVKTLQSKLFSLNFHVDGWVESTGLGELMVNVCGVWSVYVRCGCCWNCCTKCDALGESSVRSM